MARSSRFKDESNARVMFKIQDSRFKIQDSGFRIQDSRFKIQDSRFKIQDSGFKIQDSRFNQDRSNARVMFILVTIINHVCNLFKIQDSRIRIHFSNDYQSRVQPLLS